MKNLALTFISRVIIAGACVVGPLAMASSQSFDCQRDPFLLELRATGDDFRAVTLIKQKEFELRGTEWGFVCARTLLGLYLHHSEFESASGWLDQMVGKYSTELAAFGPPARLYAELAFLMGNYADARKRATGFKGDAVIQAFASAAGDPYHAPAADCSEAVCNQLQATLASREPSALKNPGLALALGVVPGLGQIYAGRVWSGVGSFLLSSVLIGATVYGINRGEYAFSTLSGAVAGGMYLSGIYAGYESTLRYNDLQEGALRTRIRNLGFEMNVLRLGF